jgi:hypothetical protein
MKKLLLLTSLLVAFVCLAIPSHAQDNELERPDKCGVAEVDKFVNKSFDTYDESLEISKAVKFISVQGEGDEKHIANAQGEPISKPDALAQLAELLVRAKKQNDNIQSVQDLQKPATDAAKKAPLQKKPKATKNLKIGADALSKTVQETKKQIEEIDRQIEDIKSME